MACPNCDSKNIETQKWNPAEVEEVPGVMYMQIVLLCKDCGWGFNCAGSLDKRPKKPKEEQKSTPV